MARHGDGTLYLDEKKNLWRAMLMTPGGKRMTKSNKDKAVVEDWLNEQRMLTGRNKHIEPHNITVGEWIDEWLDVYAKQSVRPRVYDRYKGLLSIIKIGIGFEGESERIDGIGSIKLTSLTSSHIQKFLNKLHGEYSPTTIQHMRFCLSGCLRQAVVNQMMHSNPVTAVKAPAKEKKEIEIYTEEEVTAMLEASDNHRNPLVVLIAYTTGMRLSEILALRWEDIDTSANTINIVQTIHRSTLKGVTFEPPKSKASRRKITIPADVSKAIIEHKLKYGITNGLLFLSRAGTPLAPDVYTKRTFAHIKKDANVNKGIHAFRHTHASELLTAGVPVHEVSRRLGHSRVSTTLDIYSHVMPSSDERIAAQVTALLNKKRPG